jgi:hypothetical protein
MWDAIGACWDEGDRYVLRVCPFVDYSHATETLIHEWAHLRRYERDPDSFDLHDDAYWLELGRIYRDFFPDDEP